MQYAVLTARLRARPAPWWRRRRAGSPSSSATRPTSRSPPRSRCPPSRSCARAARWLELPAASWLGAGLGRRSRLRRRSIHSGGTPARFASTSSSVRRCSALASSSRCAADLLAQVERDRRVLARSAARPARPSARLGAARASSPSSRCALSMRSCAAVDVAARGREALLPFLAGGAAACAAARPGAPARSAAGTANRGHGRRGWRGRASGRPAADRRSGCRLAPRQRAEQAARAAPDRSVRTTRRISIGAEPRV